MYWTLELASKLEDAPWPATKDELIDYAIRSDRLKFLRIFRRLKTKAMCMRVLKISGPTIPPRKTSYSTRTNIKNKRCDSRVASLFLCTVFSHFYKDRLCPYINEW